MEATSSILDVYSNPPQHVLTHGVYTVHIMHRVPHVAGECSRCVAVLHEVGTATTESILTYATCGRCDVSTEGMDTHTSVPHTKRGSHTHLSEVWVHSLGVVLQVLMTVGHEDSE